MESRLKVTNLIQAAACNCGNTVRQSALEAFLNVYEEKPLEDGADGWPVLCEPPKMGQTQLELHAVVSCSGTR